MKQSNSQSYGIRNYSIIGNIKVGFPQWRVMRCQYPDTGPSLLRAGEEVFVLGRSQKRGYLVVENGGRHVHIPHHYTELRVRGRGYLGEGVKVDMDTHTHTHTHTAHSSQQPTFHSSSTTESTLQ